MTFCWCLEDGRGAAVLTSRRPAPHLPDLVAQLPDHPERLRERREHEGVARPEAGVLRRGPDERPRLGERLVVEPAVALGQVLA